jgi:hypothetical protein
MVANWCEILVRFWARSSLAAFFTYENPFEDRGAELYKFGLLQMSACYHQLPAQGKITETYVK